MKNLLSSALFSLILLLVIGLISSFNSCTKCSESTENGEVSFYLLESFDTLKTSYKIYKATAIVKSEPLIKFSELLSYDQSKYTFKLSESAVNTLKNMQFSLSGTGFAVKAGSEIIYTGYFWTPISSMSCDWITADPLILSGGNKIKISLGYPSPKFAKGVPDDRNDERLLDIFEKSCKLK
jgi:hypothetical protein